VGLRAELIKRGIFSGNSPFTVFHCSAFLS
jgi:hypothetical protein